MQHAQLKLVGGVVAVGILAALPFARRAAPPTELAQPQSSSPALSSVPLYLPAETTQSPAVGLRDHDPLPTAPAVIAVAATSGRSHLEDNGIPPAMPEQYQPLLDGPPPAARVEPRVLHLDHPQARTHRVVDGDTLARLAQRYWQDASLAESLFAANRQVLASPDALPIGVVLTIPAKPAKSRVTIAPQEPQVELLPAPVRQPTVGVELDEPLVPINR